MPITFAQPGSTRIYEIRGSLIVSVRSHTRPIPPGELLSVGISVSSGRRASTLPRPGFRLPCRATRLPALPSSSASGERLARSPHDASTPVCTCRPPAPGFGAHYCTPMWLVCHWRDLGNMQQSCTLCWLDALFAPRRMRAGASFLDLRHLLHWLPSYFFGWPPPAQGMAGVAWSKRKPDRAPALRSPASELGGLLRS